MLYTYKKKGKENMIIDHSKYNTFKEYIDDMPQGINSWIADRAGLTKMTITRLYRGSVVPTKKTVEALCAVTGLNPAVFGVAEYKSIYKAEG